MLHVKISKKSHPTFSTWSMPTEVTSSPLLFELGQYDLNIEVKFEEARGYYLLTKKSDLDKRKLPSVFTNIAPQGQKFHYDSLDLCKKNAKLRHSLNEIYVLSFETITTLIDDVRVYIGCLYKVCEGIAMLDMVPIISYADNRSLPSHVVRR